MARTYPDIKKELESRRIKLNRNFLHPDYMKRKTDMISVYLPGHSYTQGLQWDFASERTPWAALQ
jgi:hypothetical protein